MKYLKTYEEEIIGCQKDNYLLMNIRNWMKKYNITFINLENQNFKEIVENVVNGIEEIYIIKSIVKNGIQLEIFADVMRCNKLIESDRFVEWEKETWEEIWNYLKNLTPDEIDGIRAENEAEKFNF